LRAVKDGGDFDMPFAHSIDHNERRDHQLSSSTKASYTTDVRRAGESPDSSVKCVDGFLRGDGVVAGDVVVDRF